MAIKLNIPTAASVTVSSRGQSQTVERYGAAHYAATVFAGRVNTLPVPVPASDVGTVIPRTDGGTTLDLRGVPNPAPWIATTTDGRKVALDPVQQEQKRGWPAAEYYLLAVDANDRTICEPGRNHRKLYISGSAAAMDKAAIATHAGVAIAAVTLAWLDTHREYGGSEAMPLTESLGWDVFRSRLGDSRESRSDWYLYERGYTYGQIPSARHMRGESEIHPLLIGAWGEGQAPKFSSRIRANYRDAKYTVYSGVDFDGCSMFNPYCAILEDYTVVQQGSDIQDSSLVSLRHGRYLDCYRDTPLDPVDGEVWPPHLNRFQALYVAGTIGLFMEKMFADHSGWGDGYDYNLSVEYPQPPTMYSHNFYISESVFDITFRDSILSRASSFGVMFRGGAHVENSLFLDNNIPFSTLGGNYEGAGPIGTYSLILDTVSTSAGYKLVAPTVRTSQGTLVDSQLGAYNWGIQSEDIRTALVGNIVCHRANPDDPAEQAAKPYGNEATYSASPDIYNDTVAWNWGNTDKNIGGLIPTTLDQTTIQRYTADLLGQETGTIADYVNYLRPASVDVGEIATNTMDYFRSSFGRSRPSYAAATTSVFQPDYRGEGSRWDNRLNWTTGHVPGGQFADAADLAGNRVHFGTLTAALADLRCSGGKLDVTSGKLTVSALGNAGNVVVRRAGQFWVNPGAQALDASARGGRLNITGDADALNLYAGGNAEVLLGPDCTIPADKSLTISGGLAHVGWDCAGSAALTIKGRLEFRSGVYVTVAEAEHRFLNAGQTVSGETSGFTATVGEYDWFSQYTLGANRLWLYDVAGTPQVGEQIRYDIGTTYSRDGTMTPTPSDKLVEMTSLVGWQMPTLQAFRSGIYGAVEPTAAASVTLAAGSEVVVDKTGLAPGSYDLIVANSITNNGATLPAGVSVVGGKRLVLTVS